MFVYVLVYIIIFFFGLGGLIKKKEYTHKLMFVCLFLILWLFSGFRDKTGPDWATYADILTWDFSFIQIITLEAVRYALLEPLFLLLCWVVKSIHGNINTLNVIISFAAIYLVFKRLKHLNCYPLIGALIFMAHGYFFLFSQIRQGIAVCIFFYGIQYIYDQRFKKYLICMLIAMGFHQSAIVLLPLYFVARKNINYFVVIPMLLGAILFQRLHMLALILKIAVNLTGNPILFRYYDLYIVQEMFAGSVGITSLMVEWLGWLVILTIFKKNLMNCTPYFNVFYNICWIGLTIYIAFADIAVFSRIAGYFRLSLLFLLPSILLIIKHTSHKIVFFILIAGITFIRWYTPIKTDGNQSVDTENSFIPYKNILFR